MIVYKIENELSAGEFKALLIASALDKRRPVDHPDRLKKMIKNANLIATARFRGELIGVSRALTDYSFCTYLSDLAVHQEYQRRGIGTELIRLTKLASPDARLILLAAPDAMDYYPKIGMRPNANCYDLECVDQLESYKEPVILQL